MSLSKWANRPKRGEEHVVEHHTADGVKVTVYPDKKAAKEAGMTIRRGGGEAFVHSVSNYKKYINPKWSPDERPRDEQGRFEAR